MEFLKAHRDTAILLLKNETEDLSLSSLEEMRLLVSLSTHVLPLIPKAELVRPMLARSGSRTVG